MMKKAINWKMVIIQCGFWAGAILDLLSAIVSLIYMLSPNETFINTMFGWPPISEMSYLIFITECALMFGWTALLILGAQKPIQRRSVLLLTVVPVVSMIIIFNIITMIQGNIYWSIARILPPALVSILIIIAYILACLIAKREKVSGEETTNA